MIRAAAPAAGLAAACAAGTQLLGWRGGDLPAQRYRVELFRLHGFTLWDSQWFAGHWVPDYSVLLPAVAAVVGLAAVTVAAAAVAAGCFDRLVAGRLPAPRAASAAFAVGVVVQVAIGQLDFLAGEAVGLACLLAVAGRRWVAAVPLGLLTALVAPLAAAFVAVAVAGVWLHGGSGPAGAPRRGAIAGRGWGPVAVGAAATVPLAAFAVAFPGGGTMPYPALDWVWEAAVAAGAAVAVGRGVLRTALLVYLAALTGAFAVHSPLGGNVGRAEDIAALPLALGLWWGRRPLRLAALAAFAVPLACSEWLPAVPAMTTDPASRWTAASAYAPLLGWVEAQGGPLGRLEVVPTATHYETSVLAPRLALARGWERQLDEADDALFYRRGALTAGSYLAWLRAVGVRWVALPDAPLDPAGAGEARLLRAGVPGLTPAWRAAGWAVWSVGGASGVAPPGVVARRVDGGSVDLVVERPGTYRLAVRWAPGWSVVSGAGSVTEWPGGWIGLRAPSPGPVRLRLRWP
ncbi:MAG TPA: hypothetical protein VFP61_02210 [Acidimicrobiales bacterium]|nr:hypothetical protein [Acidimicrobiales bacterium]